MSPQKHQQVEIALAVALLDVGEPVERVRKRRAVLRQQLELGHLERRLAPARLRRMAAHADDVAEIDVDLSREQLIHVWSTRSRKVDPPHLAPCEHASGKTEALLDSSVAPASELLRDVPDRGNLIPVGKRSATWLGSLRRCDVEDLVLQRAARRRRPRRSRSLLLADDRLAHRRLVRELELRGVRLGRADDEVLVRPLGVDVAEATFAPTETTLRSTSRFWITRVRQRPRAGRLVLDIACSPWRRRTLRSRRCRRTHGRRGSGPRLPGASRSRAPRSPTSASRSPRA